MSLYTAIYSTTINQCARKTVFERSLVTCKINLNRSRVHFTVNSNLLCCVCVGQRMQIFEYNPLKTSGVFRGGGQCRIFCYSVVIRLKINVETRNVHRQFILAHYRYGTIFKLSSRVFFGIRTFWIFVVLIWFHVSKIGYDRAEMLNNLTQGSS